MQTQNSYELLDFGGLEKLERFSDRVVRRPCLYASNAKRHPSIWENADFSFEERVGEWRGHSKLTEDWYVELENLVFELKQTPVGHLGVFPEQYRNWKWLTKKFSIGSEEGLKAINLFAYTGGTTMALAREGIDVTHVDGAANTVKWARRNAARSGLENARIRWIVEDVMRFLRREIKRGNTYDILIADPPSFGRGPKKEQWRISRDLPEMLDCIGQLMPNPKGVIISCHSEGYGRQRLSEMLADQFEGPKHNSGDFEKLKLTIPCEDGRQLEAGECVRWSAQGNRK